LTAIDVQEILDLAIAKTGVEQVKVRHRPRLLSDNGPCYISGELKQYLADKKIDHIRGRPYHPITQGKIERFHRSMKNVINLEKYYFPRELEKQIGEFVHSYNYERYHESLNNLTPANIYAGQSINILNKRVEIKQKTLQSRRNYNLKNREVENVCN
jgi:putative transposase